MNNKNLSFNLKSLQDTLPLIGRQLGKYALVLFLILLAAVYGFILLKINNLGNAQPDQSAISAQVKARAVPHIDPTTLQDIQRLQDNSVSVQALFNQARTNPFQE